MPSAEDALPGRPDPLPVSDNALRQRPPDQAALSRRHASRRCSAWAASGAPNAVSGKQHGVFSTAVGYAAGITPNPSYDEVCTGLTGHNEVVLVVFDPAAISFRRAAEGLLGITRPDPGDAPGQRCRHPVPVRHLCLFTTEQRAAAESSLARYQERAAGKGPGRRSRPRSSTRPSSTTPRPTTSSTWRRIRAATAGWAAPGSACRAS